MIALTLLWGLEPAAADETPAVVSGEALSLERCVEIALDMRPSLAAARFGVESQASRVGQAAAPARPHVQISPSYGYSRNESVGQSGTINTDFTLNQTIFDWRKTDLTIQGARQNFEASVLDEADAEQAVIAEVSDAYYSLNRSGRNLEIASERVANYEKRLKWAKDFYEAGAKAKIEVTRAETDLANARLDFVMAQGASSRATSGLLHAMGVSDWARADVMDVLGASDERPDAFDITAEAAVVEALVNRLDMKAEDIRVDAARTNLELAKKGMAPSLTGSAGYSFSGESDPLDERGWRLSVGLSVPVFDGGLTRERIKQADADLSAVEARRETLKQDVILAVRNAHSSLVEARESVTAAYEVERQARETLLLAQGRYRAGVGESLEISDAVDGYAQARLRVVSALYSHKSAEIALKRVMGVISE
ncbi:MAG: TolC family protein [Synergistaceae bacterium]|nr:TolC family protein [Synergistaceae bacterium]